MQNVPMLPLDDTNPTTSSYTSLFNLTVQIYKLSVCVVHEIFLNNEDPKPFVQICKM